MEPYFIPIDCHQYQLCGHVDCGIDTLTEHVVRNAKGDSFYIGMCEEHAESIQTAMACLTGRTSPHTLTKKKLLAIEELFIQPVDHEEKCKFLQWERFLENPNARVPVPVPTRELPVEASADWEWIENRKWWMSAEGEPLHMSKLETAEIVCAVFAIREKNFSRITKRIEWVKLLKTKNPTQYTYPEDALAVGYKVAGIKLEEFKEVLEHRGIV